MAITMELSVNSEVLIEKEVVSDEQHYFPPNIIIVSEQIAFKRRSGKPLYRAAHLQP
jgi:hypothetical protein